MPVVAVEITGLKGHPMEQRALEAIMNGESSRSVSRWIKPPVSAATVWRYVDKYVKPTLKNAAILSHVFETQQNKRSPIKRNTVSPVSPSVSPVSLKDDANGTQQITTRPGWRNMDPVQHCGADSEAGKLTRQALAAAPIIRLRESRIALQQDLLDRMAMVVSDRSEEMSVACGVCGEVEADHPVMNGAEVLCKKYKKIAGGASGIVARRLKRYGAEYEVDTALTAEMRELMKMSAIEQGQWQENMGTGTPTIQIICPQVVGALPRISFHEDDAIDMDWEEIGLNQGR